MRLLLSENRNEMAKLFDDKLAGAVKPIYDKLGEHDKHFKKLDDEQSWTRNRLEALEGAVKAQVECASKSSADLQATGRCKSTAAS